MGKSTVFPAHLYISSLDYKSWVLSGGPNIIASQHGVPIDRAEANGILIGFPSTQGALKTAGRIYSELGGSVGVKEIPPMVVSYELDPNILPTLTFGLEPNQILVTKEAARFLANDPIELRPGPKIPQENRPPLDTFLFSTSSANLGWALPTLGFDPRKTPYFKAKEGPESFFPQRPETDWLPIISRIVYWGALFGIPSLALIGVYIFLDRELRPKKTETQETAQAAQVHQTENTQNVLEAIITPTPVKIGYGSVKIQVDPADAKIYLNDQLVGTKAPLTLDHQSDQLSIKLTVEKKGFEPYMKIFNVEKNREFVVDVKLQKK